MEEIEDNYDMNYNYEAHSTSIPDRNPETVPDNADFNPLFTPLISTLLPIRADDDISVKKFGSARTDIDEKKKKYDWLDEEISYLQHYINQIEPTLKNSKNRYATCLNHMLRDAPESARQYFHPHHITTSDRLKNGLIRAVEMMTAPPTTTTTSN